MGRKPKKGEFPMSKLREMAEALLENPTDISETENIDITEEFLSELRANIKHNKVIIIQIVAKPREGKSTLGIILLIGLLSLKKKTT